MLEIPVFAPEFAMQPTRAARRAYVAEQLRAMVRGGGLSLSAILAGAVDGAASEAMELLAAGRDDTGKEIVPPGWVPTLRLREGAAPPDRDPQGRKLSDDKRGKVLVVKLGNRPMEAPDRITTERARRDLYDVAEVTHEARAYRTAEAVTILRQWGVTAAPEIDRHLVEEVSRAAPAKGGR